MSSLLATSIQVAKKDLRLYFRDRTGVILGFLLPIGLVGVFGFVNKMAFGSEGGLSRSTLWYVDEDESEKSQQFLASLRTANTLRLRPRSDDPAETRETLEDKLHDGEAHHCLIIPAGFGASLAGGKLPPLQMLRDPGRDLEGQMISIGLLQGLFAAAGTDSSHLLTARALQLAGLPEAWNDRIQQVSRGFQTSVELLFQEAEEADRRPPSQNQGAEPPEQSTSSGPDFLSIMNGLVPVDYTDFAPPERPKMLSYFLAQSVSGIGVMMLMFGLIACASMLIKEREDGTLPRLMVSPAPRDAYLWGKFLFALIIGAAQLVVLFAFGNLVFDVDVLRDPITLGVVSLAVLVAVTAFGMLVAAWASTIKQAEGVSTLVILTMSALGGAWYPIQTIDLPPLASLATHSTITYWAMTAYQGLFWHGKPWTDPVMLRSMAVLLGFAVVASIAAVWFYRRRYAGRRPA